MGRMRQFSSLAFQARFRSSLRTVSAGFGQVGLRVAGFHPFFNLHRRISRTINVQGFKAL